MPTHFRLSAGFLFLALSFSAHAASLNDTGQTQCMNAAGTALEACSSSNAGDAAFYPRQDARFGRDAAQGAGQLPAKIGGGAAGFDFTPLDAAGAAIAISGGVPASTPSCEYDNVTGLTWEVKTAGNTATTYTWVAAATYASDTNTAGLCGYSSGWRVPTRRELLSIVHRGVSNPSIDSNYFPNTQSSYYWSSDIYAPNPVGPWYVNFSDGNSYANYFTFTYNVRLVRSGQ